MPKENVWQKRDTSWALIRGSLNSLNIESEMVSVPDTEASVMMFLLVSFAETGWSNLASIKHLLCWSTSLHVIWYGIVLNSLMKLGQKYTSLGSALCKRLELSSANVCLGHCIEQNLSLESLESPEVVFVEFCCCEFHWRVRQLFDRLHGCWFRGLWRGIVEHRCGRAARSLSSDEIRNREKERERGRESGI